MSLLILKFGGTSVATLQKVQSAAEKIADYRRQGNDVVVVVSAMGGETDYLEDLARQLCPDPDSRELDVLLATGEQRSASLLAIALRALGYPARSFLGPTIGILTDDRHTRARIRAVHPVQIRRALAEGHIAVVAGFQGVGTRLDLTTLGRGGSDTTAVVLASALEADRCLILTDVDGIFSADPNLVPQAFLLNRVSYDEALAIAIGGAQVLEPRSVRLARINGVKLTVAHAQHPEGGTQVGRPGPTPDSRYALAYAPVCSSVTLRLSVVEANCWDLLRELAGIGLRPALLRCGRDPEGHELQVLIPSRLPATLRDRLDAGIRDGPVHSFAVRDDLSAVTVVQHGIGLRSASLERLAAALTGLPLRGVFTAEHAVVFSFPATEGLGIMHDLHDRLNRQATGCTDAS